MSFSPDLLGAFARIYHRDTADALAQAFVDDQLVQVQLNLSALGLPTIPDAEQLAALDPAEVKQAFTSRDRVIWGVSATYNTAHPDPATRAQDTTRAAHFIASLGGLKPVAATLCTGTRDPDRMWQAHPDNTTASAWRDLRGSLDALLPAAAQGQVLLAVEPEPGNIIANTADAQRLVSELGDDADQLGFILDPTNLVAGAAPRDYESILSEAFAALGERTICVHAKDVHPWADTLLGRPGVDYELVARLHQDLPHQVPLIIQDATEAELPQVRDFLYRQGALASTP